MPDGLDPPRIAGDDFADETEVGRGAFFARAKEQAVAAGESDSGQPKRAKRGYKPFVDLAGKDHQRNVAGLGVRDAEAVDEFALLAEGF